MAADIFQIGELLGITAIISALVSAAVNFVLEQWKFKKERAEAKQEEHLKYSVENYPRFSEVLTEVIHGLNFSRNARLSFLQGAATQEEFEERATDLLYLLGRLLAFEQEFREKQGQIFRLATQSGEILTEFLYKLGKNNLQITDEQEIYLPQTMRGKTLKEFRETAKTDPELGKIRSLIEKNIDALYPARFTAQNFDTLSRLLMNEIQSIRIPGYERQPISLSKPDQDYIEAVKRVPTVFFSRESLDQLGIPLRIWVYNHWNHDIRFGKNEVQLVVEPHSGGADSSKVEMSLFDPDDRSRKKQFELKPGQTLAAEWNRKWNNGEPKAGDVCRITYLPNSENPASRLRLTYTR